MFADTAFSDSQVFILSAIATASIIYPLILCGIAALGYFQHKVDVET